MSRVAWTRWSAEEVAQLRLLAADHTAAEAGVRLGKTEQQVRGAVRRFGIVMLVRGGAKHRRRVERIAAAVSRAWRDPVKRERMHDGILSRDLAGAAVLGSTRRAAEPDVLARQQLFRLDLYARAATAVPRGMPPADRDDVISEVVVGLLIDPAADVCALAKEAAKAHRSVFFARDTVSFEQPLFADTRRTIGDKIAAAMWGGGFA